MLPFRKKLSPFELTGYVLIVAGALVLVWAFFQFNLLLPATNGAQQEQFGQFGEFVSGIVGSLWALAGVFLFFATLTYQKREFELQRIELHKTQKIFQQQNFSTLFTSFLSQHNHLITTLKASDIQDVEWTGNSYFIFFKEKVLTSYINKVRTSGPEQCNSEALYLIFKDYFEYHYSFYEKMLNPYIKNLGVLFSMLALYRTETDDETDYYSLIIRANLSEAELFMIYHLALYNLVPDFATYGRKFDIFEKLPETDRVTSIVSRQLTDCAQAMQV